MPRVRAAVGCGWRCALVGWLAALLVAPAGGCSGEGPRPNIVLIVADTLRADHLGVFGYELPTSPTLDRFARENLLFAHAVTPAPWTSPAMASIFTGLYPTAHGVARDSVGDRIPTDALSQGIVTLAERLQAAGYSTAALVSNAWVSPARGYAQGFDRFLLRSDLHTPALNRLARRMIEELGYSGAPFFFYIHYMDPHMPLNPPGALIDRFHPEGERRRPPETPLENLVDQIARYDAEIFQLDRGVAELFAHLRELDLYDETVIAFVSDHGEQFYEHGLLGHGRLLHNEETHVPLFLKAPGASGRVDSVVSTLDLGPTLLEIARAEPLEDAQGLSLLTQRDERARRGVFSEGTRSRNHKSFVDADAMKLVLAFSGLPEQVVGPEDEIEVVGLFETLRNYREDEPLDDAETTAALRTRLLDTLAASAALRAGRSDGHDAKEVELDAATLRELEELGYVETSDAKEPVPPAR